MDGKKLRIIFVDDENIESVSVLKSEGFDVEQWHDVDNLEKLVDGRYQVVFLDVRGIGEKYKGNGLDVLRYVAENNPLIYRIVFSAKPFTAEENETTRRYANRVMTKDCSVYEIIDVINGYGSSLNQESLLLKANATFPLTWYEKYKLKRGRQLSDRNIEKIAARVDISGDAIKIARNVTKFS